MRARERRKYQGTSVWSSRIDRHARIILILVYDIRHIVQVKLGIHTLAVHVQGEGHDVHVPGPLSVSEDRPLNPIRTGKFAQLCVCHAGPAVIVRVKRKHDVLPVLQIVGDVLDLICIDAWHGKLHRRRQIDDGLAVRCRLPDIENGIADLKRILRLCPGEALRTVLKAVLLTCLVRQLLQKHGTLDGNLFDLFL